MTQKTLTSLIETFKDNKNIEVESTDEPDIFQIICNGDEYDSGSMTFIIHKAEHPYPIIEFVSGTIWDCQTNDEVEVACNLIKSYNDETLVSHLSMYETSLIASTRSMVSATTFNDIVKHCYNFNTRISNDVYNDMLSVLVSD